MGPGRSMDCHSALEHSDPGIHSFTEASHLHVPPGAPAGTTKMDEIPLLHTERSLSIALERARVWLRTCPKSNHVANPEATTTVKNNTVSLQTSRLISEEEVCELNMTQNSDSQWTN